MIPAGIEPATFRFVAQHLKHRATSVPIYHEEGVKLSRRTLFTGSNLWWNCATSRKVAGLNPDGVIRIVRWFITSGRTMVLGFEWASNRNYYQEYFLGCKGGRYIGLKTLPNSCSDCLDIWEPQPRRNIRARPGLYRYCFALKRR